MSFIGRADDVITSSGYRIGPFDVESALIEHPAVSEAAVIGVARSGAHGDREGVRRTVEGLRRHAGAGRRTEPGT
ncbi:AMP-binding enzyme [Burkholderia pyrrocinia]|uniref:AMP-binding enzyme n=1 Tax=Burkholderia pyrrocinia TaxID=60550 RepID=UPI000B09BEC7